MQCEFIKSDGNRCKSYSMQGSAFCYLHNSNISDKSKNEARSKGGKQKIIKVLNPLKDNIKINNVNDINILITYLINEVLGNRLDLRVATGVTYMANCLLKVFEISDIEKRIDTIERNITK